MRNCPNVKAERERRLDIAASAECVGMNAGVFQVGPMRVIVSDGGGWDHVSVSLSCRTPTWEEMCKIKELFFKDDEVAMQLHPAKKDYINMHPYCLHLWRPQTREDREIIQARFGVTPFDHEPQANPIPLPPTYMVGTAPSSGFLDVKGVKS